MRTTHPTPAHSLAHSLTLAFAMGIAALAPHTAWAQIIPEGQTFQTQAAGTTVCLFTQGTQPTMSATQPDADTFVWLYAPDAASEPTELRRQTGVTSDKLTVAEPGLYTLRTSTAQTSMWWLSPAPPAVTFTVDSADCDAVYVTATATDAPIMAGDTPIEQDLTFHWEAGGEELQSSKEPDAALEGLYDAGLLTLRVTNQAFNEVAHADSVFPKGVRAVLEFANRKEMAPNENQESGDVISSPAEIAFTNKSLGSYTVSEWAVGNIARLYETDPIYQFQQPGTFTVALTVTNEASGCASTDSTTKITVSDAALEFPNAFTPNGDGNNDIFMPAFRSLKTYELTIYNRWGRRVFSTSDPTKGWDGTEHGRKAAAGTYYYTAKAEGYEKGVTFSRKGSITLLR